MYVHSRLHNFLIKTFVLVYVMVPGSSLAGLPSLFLSLFVFLSTGQWLCYLPVSEVFLHGRPALLPSQLQGIL